MIAKDDDANKSSKIGSIACISFASGLGYALSGVYFLIRVPSLMKTADYFFSVSKKLQYKFLAESDESNDDARFTGADDNAAYHYFPMLKENQKYTDLQPFMYEALYEHFDQIDKILTSDGQYRHFGVVSEDVLRIEKVAQDELIHIRGEKATIVATQEAEASWIGWFFSKTSRAFFGEYSEGDVKNFKARVAESIKREALSIVESRAVSTKMETKTVDKVPMEVSCVPTSEAYVCDGEKPQEVPTDIRSGGFSLDDTKYM